MIRCLSGYFKIYIKKIKIGLLIGFYSYKTSNKIILFSFLCRLSYFSLLNNFQIKKNVF